MGEIIKILTLVVAWNFYAWLDSWCRVCGQRGGWATPPMCPTCFAPPRFMAKGIPEIKT